MLPLAFLAQSQAVAGDFIFSNGFESGALCAWSFAGCSVDSILSRLESATTVGENKSALLAALETAIGSVPPEIHDTADLLAEYFTKFPDTKGGLLSIAQTHLLATISMDSPPTLQQAIAALTDDVKQAYANPQKVGSAKIILMFSATSDMPFPLPLSADSELTFTGSITYAAWLVEQYPSSFMGTRKDTTAECHTKVNLNKIAAISQIMVRNTFAIIIHTVLAILNAGEAIVNCGSGGATEIAGVVLDAVEGCLVSNLVSWVEVQADADCIANVSGPSNAAGCIAGLVPCLGDIYGFIANSQGVAQATENLINGICTVLRSHDSLHAACDEGCPDCSVLKVRSGCSPGNIPSLIITSSRARRSFSSTAFQEQGP
jgi:hypothetical protein